ncbi:MAG: DUF5683 domain-containing protein [Cyclobacteriaceae bacterium]
MKKRVVIALSIALNVNLLVGQDTERDIELITDSTFIRTDEDIQLFQEVSDLDPQRSALLSAIVPGMGQVYNKQYWKVPIIYAGLATFAHFINYNNDLYHAFRNAAISNSNGLGNPFSDVSSSQTTVIRNRDNFRRNRDFLIILGSVFYLLNIVDAHVSAHLEEFNINDDLALTIEPSMQNTSVNSAAIGASLILRIK